jgi:8-oxo-dGTP diphosphatase
MKYRPIIGTLGYILSPEQDKVLLVHRMTSPHDDHFGKYNGLGGKVHANEDVLTGMKRELQEEAGIEATAMTLRGSINWTGFGKHGEDWLGFIFLITQFTGKPNLESPEGPLSWHPIESIDSLPMWDGDRLFLPLVFDKDPRPFHAHMPYKEGKVIGWSYSRL